jgi:hypothetical protein
MATVRFSPDKADPHLLDYDREASRHDAAWSMQV